MNDINVIKYLVTTIVANTIDNVNGRDPRTLSKLFEGIVNTPDDCDRILLKAKEAVDAPKKKFIVGLMY